MKITVRVKPRSKQSSIVQADDGTLVVAVHEAPSDGEANDAVVRAIARHFHVAQSCVQIIRGVASRTKLIDVIIPKSQPRDS